MSMVTRHAFVPVIYKEYLGDSVETTDVASTQQQDDIFGVASVEPTVASGYNSDFNNVGVYAEPREILCAIDGRTDVVNNGTKQEALHVYTYITKEKITPKSILDDHIIMSVLAIPGCRGKIEHYEATMI